MNCVVIKAGAGIISHLTEEPIFLKIANNYGDEGIVSVIIQTKFN